MTLDVREVAYHPNGSTDNSITFLLHTALAHLHKNSGNYVRMLCVDYSSAFNTIIPSRVITKLRDFTLDTSL